MRGAIKGVRACLVILLMAGAVTCTSCLAVRQISEPATEPESIAVSEPGNEIIPTLKTVREGYLTLGICPGMKPYSDYEQGKLVGFDVDLAVKISGSLGLKLQLITMDFEELITSCLQDEVDGILGMSYTSLREKLLFASDPYMSEEVEGEPMDVVFYAKSSTLVEIFDSLLQAYKEDGTYAAWIKRYFPELQQF